MKNYVLRLEVVVNDALLLLAFVEVLEAAENLRNDELGLFFLEHAVHLHVVLEVRPRAEFEDSAEAVGVDFDGVEVADDAAMDEVLVDLVFSQGVLDVVCLHRFRPLVLEMVDFARHFSAVLQVERLVHLRVPALPKQSQDQVLLLRAIRVLVLQDLRLVSHSGVAELRAVFFSKSLHFRYVGHFLLF